MSLQPLYDNYWRSVPVPLGCRFPECLSDHLEWKAAPPEKYEVILFGTSGRQKFMRFLGGDVAG